MCCILPVSNKNRSISAQSVNELATKMGCPSDFTTKLSKLGWIFLQLQAWECMQMHTYAYECIRMHTNANGYIWMQTNAYTSEHTRVNASAYTSECVCEWMHLNALECVRMRVRQNATCRQNAPYVGRHTNAFECNSCRMQRTANAQ